MRLGSILEYRSKPNLSAPWVSRPGFSRRAGFRQWLTSDWPL